MGTIELLKDFMATMEAQGHATASVAKQTITALEKAGRVIAEDPKQLTPDDLARPEVVKAIFSRFLTKFKELKPESAGVYVNRVLKAAENYRAYQHDPLGFQATFGKVEISSKKPIKESKASSRQTKKGAVSLEQVQSELERQAADGDRFTTVFPLRRNVMLNLNLPNDLKAEEVRRMACYLLTLCEDFNPGTTTVWPQAAPAPMTSLPDSA